MNLLVVFMNGISGNKTYGQTERPLPEKSELEPPSTLVWLGTYGIIRLGDKLFWDAQTHYRRGSHGGVPWVGRMTQIYNRHGLTYQFNKDFRATIGGVLRLNFTPEPTGDDKDLYDYITPEPRIWHEYLFKQEFGRVQIFHRLRMEHRWNRSNLKNSEFIYRDRWRYKIFANIPINKPRFEPGTWFFTPDVEIIMQSGSPVIDSPLEDLRIQPIIGYIASPRIKHTLSMMYTMGQRRYDGSIYRQRWIGRLNVYFNLDWRSGDSKVPIMQMLD
ncbi:MAG: DUF2490 domain-containing protein [Cryomorphaceae bacterium]|nr:DUF2490 domain-containing protein [Cryomorphaceae bacterium]